MKFLIDECLSHTYVAEFNARGYPDAVHPIHIGRRGARDDQLLELAISRDRIIVGANGRDFRKLLSAAPIHPGAILVEGRERANSLRLILLGIGFAAAQEEPEHYMINRVIEVSLAEGVRPYSISST